MVKLVKAFISGLSAKEKRYVYIAGAFLLLTLFDRIVIGPFANESKMLDEKIISQKEITRKNLLILSHEDRIIDEVEIYNDYYANDLSSKEELIARFLSEVEGFSKSAGLNLTNIDPVQADDKEGHTEFSLAIGCEGNMKNILDFFYNVENSKRPVRIVSFEVTPKSRDGQDVRCNLTLSKLIVYKPALPKSSVD
jgi:Tfp pilus assembly protein PilO